MPTRIDSNDSLLVIDIQQKLFDVLSPERQERLTKATLALIELAASVDARLIYTEQYPAGLGETIQEIAEPLQKHGATRIEKVHFDASGAPAFAEQLAEMGRRVVVCGIEAHVCVLSTVQSLRRDKRDVFVPFDAVASRDEEYRRNGLDQMRTAGAVVTNSETMLFATLRSSKHPDFKRLSRMIR